MSGRISQEEAAQLLAGLANTSQQKSEQEFKVTATGGIYVKGVKCGANPQYDWWLYPSQVESVVDSIPALLKFVYTNFGMFKVKTGKDVYRPMIADDLPGKGNKGVYLSGIIGKLSEQLSEKELRQLVKQLSDKLPSSDEGSDKPKKPKKGKKAEESAEQESVEQEMAEAA
jgi:hypothetical protein